MNAEIFGSFIQTRRKTLGMRQAQLAEKLHVTAKAVSRWERGIGFPSIELLQPLAEALGITIVELMQSCMLEAELSKEEAAEVVTETIGSIHNREKKQRKKIYLLFLLLPLVYGAQLFLLRIYFDVEKIIDSRWRKFLFYEIIFLVGALGAKAVYYVMRNEYSKLREAGLAKRGLLACIILTAVGLILMVGISIWRIGDKASALMFWGIALVTGIVCYFYFLRGRKSE